MSSYRKTERQSQREDEHSSEEEEGGGGGGFFLLEVRERLMKRYLKERKKDGSFQISLWHMN